MGLGVTESSICTFNLGRVRFAKFKRRLSPIWRRVIIQKASVEFLDSLWAKQVKGRGLGSY